MHLLVYAHTQVRFMGYFSLNGLIRKIILQKIFGNFSETFLEFKEKLGN